MPTQTIDKSGLDVAKMYGGIMPKGASISVEEAMKQGNLDWKCELGNIYDQQGEPIPGYFRTFRDDTDDTLGIVRTKYVPYQNADAFSFIEELVGEGNAKITAAGCLKNGKKTFLCADLGGFEVVKNDELRKHLVVTNSHNGTSNIALHLLAGRLACANMLPSLAKNRDLSQVQRIRHTISAGGKMVDAAAAFGLAKKTFDDLQTKYKHMSKVKYDDLMRDRVIRDLYNIDDDEWKLYATNGFDHKPRWIGERERIIKLTEEGAGTDIKGVKGTLWGLYNGITEFADHYRTVRGESNDASSRIENNMLGTSAQMKEKALQACIALIK